MPNQQFDATAYQCALCFPVTAHQETFATQTELQPPTAPLPQQAQLFSSPIDLINLMPASFGADVTLNADEDRDGTEPGLLIGTARGTANGVAFDDAYAVARSAPNRYTDPSKQTTAARQWVFSLAATTANHVPVPANDARQDLVGTVLYQPVFTDTEKALTMFQAGTHGIAQGQTVNIMQLIQHRRVSLTSEQQPWDLLAPGSVGDYKVAGYYTARGINFVPADGTPGDALVGLHGLSGESTYNVRSPFATKAFVFEPMILDLSAWRFGDGHSRYENAAATITVPMSPHIRGETEQQVSLFGLVMKASRGFVAASAASAAVASTPLTDAGGGAAQIPQSSFELDGAIAGGAFSPGSEKPSTGKLHGTDWSVQAGYAIRTDAVCLLIATPPCGPVHHNQLTFNAAIQGSRGFLTVALGPATLPSSAARLATNPNASAPRTFGDFVNHNSWNAQAGVHILSSVPSGVCTTAVASASNTAPPPELTTALPGTSLNVGGFVEVVPLRSSTPLAIFVGAAHSIANTAQPAFGSATTLGSKYVSTVTYAAKISFGSEGYRNHLRRNCAWQFASPP